MSFFSGEKSIAKNKKSFVIFQHEIECLSSSYVFCSKSICVGKLDGFAPDAAASGFEQLEEASSLRRIRDFPMVGKRGFSDFEQSASWNGSSQASSDGELGSGCLSKAESNPSRVCEGARSVSKSDAVESDEGSDGMFVRSVCSQLSRGNVKSESGWAADKMTGIMELIPNKKQMNMLNFRP